MNAMPWMKLTATVVALAALCVFVLTRRNVATTSPDIRREPEPAPHTAHRSADAERELLSVREQVNLLEDQVRNLSQRSNAAVAAPADSEVEPAPASSPSQLRTTLDERMEEEASDARWAPREQKAFESFFAELPASAGKLVRAECRETLCKLRIRFEGEARGRFETERLGTAPFDKGGFLQTDETTGELLLYTAREGHTLAATP